ncbi:MAG: OmpA family protein [Gammaproteobacteria bacterium]|nr:OmpA family protein [Gammaproteobacteria bacterium]
MRAFNHIRTSLLSSVSVVMLGFACNVFADASSDVPGTVRAHPLELGEDYSANTEQLFPINKPTAWEVDKEQFKQAEDEKVKFEKKTVEEFETVKTKNLIQPIRFALGKTDIPPEYLEAIRNALAKMSEKRNVRLNFVGHTDNQKLAGKLKTEYGDNAGLSRARAAMVAEYFQRELGLPPEAVAYDGRGDLEPLSSNVTSAGRALNRRVEVEFWHDEVREREVEQKVIDTKLRQVRVCQVVERCIYKRQVGKFDRVQVENTVPPIRYTGIQPELPEGFIKRLRDVLKELSNMPNISIRVVGHTDNQPLDGAAERIYNDKTGLSKAIAQHVAQQLRDALGMGYNDVQFVGKGDIEPVSDNSTSAGRALNRRVEIEIWHDDLDAKDISEPQACPGDSQAENVSVRDDNNKIIVPFVNGQPAYPVNFTRQIQRVLKDLSKKANVRIHLVGHTSNERMSRREAMVYGDHVKLSETRAVRVREFVQKELSLTEEQVSTEGKGFVQPLNEVDTSPFAQKNFSLLTAASGEGSEETVVRPEDARVELEFYYDEEAKAKIDSSIEIIRVQHEEPAVTPYALHPIRVTIDGKPIDGNGRHTADVQRCTDLALDRAQLHFQYDGIKRDPKLNVHAEPSVVTYWDDPGTEAMENSVNFNGYTNYSAFIDKSEVRVFGPQQSLLDTPLVIVPLDKEGNGQWLQIPKLEPHQGPKLELRYVLRVYDARGRFDETQAKPLWVLHRKHSDIDQVDTEKESLVGYGETRIAVRHIPLEGGTVIVYGENIPAAHDVWVMNQKVPVNEQGQFVTERIIPPGMHTAEVAIFNEKGAGNIYLRDLEFKETEYYYVGIADVTVSKTKVNGPAELLATDSTSYDDGTNVSSPNDFDALAAESIEDRDDIYVDGRLAFYTKIKTASDYIYTASLDTREGEFDTLTKGVLDKQPDALWRRMDADSYYPTYGDDSTVIDDAPTSGKLYMKVAKNESFAMFGNFEAEINDTDLARIDRSLYGFYGHYESPKTTKFGDNKTDVDMFYAQPGTVAGHEEFRGTGGSLYFLRYQDINPGSERLRVEVRDKDSGIVRSVRYLVPEQDYSVNYIQGRIMLTRPLSTSAADDTLVQTDSNGGNPVYMVVRYEYTPGFDDLKDTDRGGRIAHWINDNVQVGVSTNKQQMIDDRYELSGYDFTVRKAIGTYLKYENADSIGESAGRYGSIDGGFGFNELDNGGIGEIGANAYRLEGAANLTDLRKKWRGRSTFYIQEREAGFSSLGLGTSTDVSQQGFTVYMPLTARWNMYTKYDNLERETGLSLQATEVNLDYKLTDNWKLSGGLRSDEREDTSIVVSSDQVEGKRTDLQLRATYDSLQDWTLYGFTQFTIETTGSRPDNNRNGVGGSYQITDRLGLDGEVSAGDGGTGARVGLDYLMTDRTNLYLAYGLQNERSDTGQRAKNGNTTAGFRTRYTDNVSVYGEERYAFGDVPTGLTHAYGVTLAPADDWTIGGSIEWGSLEDPVTYEVIDRSAYGFNVGLGREEINYAGAIEYREDVSNSQTRETILYKNNFNLQLDPSWRLLMKYNRADSKSSNGTFYDGNFQEFVTGFAHRPVTNDRWNTLFKFTFFENTPSIEQVNPQGTNIDFLQRSNVLSVDSTYDLTTRWSVGGKYAYRNGEVALDRENPVFFESNASLYVARVDWHVLRSWDWLIEARSLEVEAAQDVRSGYLTALYWHATANMKLGAGYNFTDFSDDLTDLDYDSKGFFINAIGKF